jgi:death-on-curing protein
VTFEYLELDDLIVIATALLGNPPPIRDIGFLSAAVARPQATAFGEDAYADSWTKAAALVQSLLKSHAPVDGNKRLAWVATATFLEINGIRVTHVDNDTVERLVYGLASGHEDVDETAEKLRTSIVT